MDVTDAIRKSLNASITLEENRNPWARGIWQNFNTGSVEVEVGEFLYGLVRLLKPRRVVETGTYYGASAAYVGLALKRNGAGRLVSLETNPQFCQQARAMLTELDITDYVTIVNQDAATYAPDGEIDMLFLDSEPQYRFAEFDRFYPYLAPGGMAAIHDLHWHLGLTWYRNNDMLHWPYGDFREHEVGRAIRDHELQVFPFFTPRGLVVFQKVHPEFVHYRLLTDTLEEVDPWPH